MKKKNKNTNTNLKNAQGVYSVIVTDGDTDYIYIGSGKLGDRVAGNQSKLKRAVHANRKLQTAYNKVGSCRVEILDTLTANDVLYARELEEAYIKYFKAIDGIVVCNKAKPSATSEPYKIKLDENKVREIRELIAQGKSDKEIAKLYDVTAPTITKVKNRQRWGWVV